jgi:hypothetical protein
VPSQATISAVIRVWYSRSIATTDSSGIVSEIAVKPTISANNTATFCRRTAPSASSRTASNAANFGAKYRERLFSARSAMARPAYLVEDQPGPVAVLDRGGVDHDPHRQPFAVDEGVDFAALHLLAGVVTHLVVSTAPFSADWLSRTAAEGLPSRPILSRNAICSSAQIASQTPSRWNLRKML